VKRRVERRDDLGWLNLRRQRRKQMPSLKDETVLITSAATAAIGHFLERTLW